MTISCETKEKRRNTALIDMPSQTVSVNSEKKMFIYSLFLLSHHIFHSKSKEWLGTPNCLVSEELLNPFVQPAVVTQHSLIRDVQVRFYRIVSVAAHYFVIVCHVC
jgi:hypothetical protein